MLLCERFILAFFVFSANANDFLDKLVDNDITIGIQSVVHDTWLRSDKHHEETFMQNYQGAWEKLYLERNSQGGYSIKSRTHGTCLRADNNGKGLKFSSYCGSWERWELIGGDADDIWVIRSYSPQRSYLRADRYEEPVTVVSHNYSWEKWRIVPERKIESMEYHIDRQTTAVTVPEVLGKIVKENHCPAGITCPNQSSTLSVSESRTSTRSWSHTAGVGVTVGMSFSAGVPLLAETEFSVEVSASYEHSWGTEESTTKDYSISFDCVAGSGLRVTCEFDTKKQILDVPFTITWNTGEKTYGVYNGVTFMEGYPIITNEILADL